MPIVDKRLADAIGQRTRRLASVSWFFLIIGFPFDISAIVIAQIGFPVLSLLCAIGGACALVLSIALDRAATKTWREIEKLPPWRARQD